MTTTTTSSTATRTTASTSDLAATLARIDARLERLERRLAPITELAEHAPALAATVGDIVDERAAQLGDVEDRVGALFDLLERLTRPQTLASLRQVVDLAESAPNLVATAVDVFDEVMAEASREGLDLTHLVDDSKRLAMGLLRLTTSPELRALMTSGMLDPRALTTLGSVARTVVEANETEPPKVGMFGAVRALGNDDVQRAVGFLLRVAGGFGRSLRREDKRLSR
ncbi:MAG: DUF1641 domain-containing protein [Sandaracinus sp.]|nr:DUF1641 domain-containing protein [Myxococcales bacterium]MCB9616752.1 DUF1641 domain-containing protein [Sandaracinus sp.]